MPLGDFVTLQRGHDLPDAIRRPGNRPVLGSFGVTGWHDKARAAGPGVTVGRSGASFGVVSYSPVDYWPLNTTLYVIDFHGNDPRFAYYFLKQFDFRTYNSGSAQPSLNRNFIHPIPVDVPPLPEQRTIAHILGTLDDKIELNRRMNETLEEMARALFKSWFVDFDPVHAKATLKHHAANQAPRQGVSTPATEAARSGTTPPLRGSRQAKGVSPQARRRGEIRRLYSPQTLQKAQALRHNQTNAEGLLWHYLRNKQLGGYKFRRQQPIGPYIADFACLSQKLLIELDGSQHAARQDYDAKRDAFLRERGYRVLRFWNNEVFENCFGVLERIYAVLPHQPPLEGGSEDASLSGRGDPPPQQPAPDGLAAATPPQGGSDWTVERARAYLENFGQEIANLFPDAVGDDGGPIGWGQRALYEMAEFANGAAYKNMHFSPEREGLPVIKIAELKHGITASTKFTKTELGEKYRINTGEILFSWSGNPDTSIDTFIWNDGPAWLNQHIFRVRENGDATRALIYFQLKQLKPALSEIARNKQTTGLGHITARDMKELMVCDPPKPVVNAFEEIVGPMFLRVVANLIENKALARTRDLLLPRLISGEIRANEVEKAVEAVV